MAAPSGTLAADARVLAIVVARIGDTLLATAALRALKAAIPGGTFAVLAHPKCAEVLRHLPFVDRLGTITKNDAWLRGHLSAKRYDCAVVYGEDAALIRYALRVSKRVVAFRQADEDLNRRLSPAVARPAAPIHAVHERLRLAQAVGADAAGEELSYLVLPSETHWARRLLESAFPQTSNPADESPLVGFQSRSFPTKEYRDWPLENFKRLAALLFERWPGARLVILGGKESRAGARQFASAFPGRAASLAGELRLRQTAAVMACLDLYVGVDTGPTHLAGALKVPMVALYHCRHRGRHLAPLGHPALTVIEHPAADAECSRTSSMDQIPVPTVWEAVRARLEQRPTPSKA